MIDLLGGLSDGGFDKGVKVVIGVVVLIVVIVFIVIVVLFWWKKCWVC